MSHSNPALRFARRVFPSALLAAGLIAASGQASAFSEDICHANNGNLDLTRVENCWDLQCMDDGDSGACVVLGFTKYINATMIQTPGDTTEPRSSVHFDLVWMLARAAGMNEANATTVASYAQAPDFGGYTHYNLVSAANYTTEEMPGLVRSDLDNGAAWFHFVPRTGNPLTAPRTSDGSLPYNPAATQVFGSYEAPLNHIRNWAFGKAPLLCAFGLTDAAGRCLNGKPMTATYAMFGPTDITKTYTLRDVNLDPNDPGLNARLAATLPSLGIYLHALADRVSHYYCSEDSFLRSNFTGTAWSISYPNSQCGQVQHAMMHYPEVGHADIPARTFISQDLFWKEINQWLAKYPQYRSYAALQIPGKGSISLTALTTDADNALKNGGAAQRMSALCQVSRNYGLGWHDGNDSCQYSAP